MDFAHDPFFNPVDEFGRRYPSSSAIDQPGVGQANKETGPSQYQSSSSRLRGKTNSAYRPADIVGHVLSLQIGKPVSPFIS